MHRGEMNYREESAQPLKKLRRKKCVVVHPFYAVWCGPKYMFVQYVHIYVCDMRADGCVVWCVGMEVWLAFIAGLTVLCLGCRTCSSLSKETLCRSSGWKWQTHPHTWAKLLQVPLQPKELIQCVWEQFCTLHLVLLIFAVHSSSLNEFFFID